MMRTRERIAKHKKFLADLTKLSKKHGVVIRWSGGPGGPYLVADEERGDCESSEIGKYEIEDEIEDEFGEFSWST